MKPKLKRALLIAGLCLVSATAGFSLFRLFNQPAEDAPGSAAPELVLTDLSGARHPLSEWRGRLLLVNFWATWCAPCMNEIPLLVKAQAQYGSRGLQIIGPAMDDPLAVQAALPRLGIVYPVLVGDSEVANAMTALGDTLGALPFSVLIGTDGTILKRKHGEFEQDELQKLIEKHLP